MRHSRWVGVIAVAAMLTGCTAKIDGLASPAPDLGHSPALVAVGALEGLLLPSEQLDTLLLAQGMAVKESSDEGITGKTWSDDCAETWAVAWLPMYTGSGWIALRVQRLESRDREHRIWQAVVSFPLAVDAKAYYAKQVAAWATCNNRRIHIGVVENDNRDAGSLWALGQSDQHDNILTITATEQDLNDWSCQRALTHRNNVVADIEVCGKSLTDQAESVAKTIAAKVPVK